MNATRPGLIILHDAQAVGAMRACLPYSRPKAAVRLDCTSLTASERQWWEERLSRYYPACGCSPGAALMVTTAMLGAVHVACLWWSTAALPWRTLMFVLMSTVLAAVTGKFLGLLAGHLRMSRALRALELRLRRSCETHSDPAVTTGP